jgi:hypothetical protein
MLILGSSLKTLDVNCVKCSPTCALLHHPNEAQLAGCGDQTNHHPRLWDLRAGQSNQLSKHSQWQVLFFDELY